MIKITAERFAKAVGREPVDDDLERCNCDKAGQISHMMCGWDIGREMPNFIPSNYINVPNKWHSSTEDGTMRSMQTAKKNGTPVLALLRDDLALIRPDLERLHGLWVVVRAQPNDDWCLAGPFGYGGLPDEWFVGWSPLPDKPK
jgi:hypothetical protein